MSEQRDDGAAPEAEATDELDAAIQKASRLRRLWDKSPGTVLVTLLLGGVGTGTVGSLFLAPWIMPHVDAGIANHQEDDDAHGEVISQAVKSGLDKHKQDPQGHPVEFQRLSALEVRVGQVEDDVVEQGREIATMSGNMSAALRLLERID